MSHAPRLPMIALVPSLIAMTAAVNIASGSVLSLSNVIAVAGQQVPGQAPGVTYGTLANNPSVSSSGIVAWGGALAGVPAVNNQAAFVATSSSNIAIAGQSGTAAPGGPAGATLDLNGGSNGFQTASVRINGSGTVSFVSLMTGGGTVPNTNNWGVFAGPASGSVSMIARSGQQVQGAAAGTTTGATFANGVPVVGDTVYFGSSTVGGDTVSGTNNSVITRSTSNAFTTLVRQGNASPAGGNYASVSNPTLQANASGQLLFSSSPALYRYDPISGVTVLHATGQAAPGTAGATYGGSAQVFSANFNNQGQAIFTSSLTGGDVVGTTNNTGVFISGNSGTSLLWRNGSAAPGVAGGTFLSTNSIGYMLSNSGSVALPASLVQGGAITAANDSGIWLGGAGSFSLVVREGDAVPTLNATFGALGNVALSVNALDQLVFTASMVSSDTNLNNKTALVGYSASSGVFPIAYAGESLEVTPGVFKTISSFGIARGHNADGGSLGFSDTGVLAVRVTFSDTTSAIVSYVVPSPSVIVLGALAVPFAMRRRR